MRLRRGRWTASPVDPRMNERGQYGSPGAERGQYGPLRAERGQYGPPGTESWQRGTLSLIMHFALHVAGIMLVGLGLAYLLIRWSGV